MKSKKLKRAKWTSEMIYSAEETWQHLNTPERKRLLRHLFFTVLLSHDECPTFMTEEDWIDMHRQSKVHHLNHRRLSRFCIVLLMETFAYRYWTDVDSHNYFRLLSFLESDLARVTIGHFPLFQPVGVENERMWFYFNMDAVLAWMSIHQPTGPRDQS